MSDREYFEQPVPRQTGTNGGNRLEKSQTDSCVSRRIDVLGRIVCADALTFSCPEMVQMLRKYINFQEQAHHPLEDYKLSTFSVDNPVENI